MEKHFDVGAGPLQTVRYTKHRVFASAARSVRFQPVLQVGKRSDSLLSSSAMHGAVLSSRYNVSSPLMKFVNITDNQGPGCAIRK